MKRKHSTTAQDIAALAMPLSGGVAGRDAASDMPPGMNAQLFPDGEFAARDGRPARLADGSLTAWRMSAAIAAPLAAQVADRATPLAVDYEHQLILARQNGQPAPASGWVDRVAYFPGRGLYAAVKWTAKAAGLISADEYRYISPVFRFNPDTGAVLQLLSVALTNNPALDGMDAVALAALFPAAATAASEESMDELLKRLRWLLNQPATATAEDVIAALDKLKGQLSGGDAAASVDLPALLTGAKGKDAQIADLTAKLAAGPDPATYAPVAALTALQQANAALTAKVAELTNGAQATKIDGLIQAALADGRLTKGLEPWARQLGATNEAALTAYLSAAAPVAALKTMQTAGLPGGQPPAAGANVAALSDEQLKICKTLQLDPKDYAQALSKEVA